MCKRIIHWKGVSIIPEKSVSIHLFKLSGIEKNFAKKLLWVQFFPTKATETNFTLVERKNKETSETKMKYWSIIKEKFIHYSSLS